MKLNILSDLHLGFGLMERPLNDADVVVLAGDIARPRQAAAWALRFRKPVLYVIGNHEFYGSSIDGTVAQLRALFAGTNVHLLERDELIIDGVRFLGATLWSDFKLDADEAARALAIEEATRLVRDFSRIRRRDDGDALFTPLDARALFDRDADWLDQQLALAHDGPTVVITHHAPSPRSIPPRFAGSPLNACFVSNAERLLGGERVHYWIHGHLHDSFDYDIAGTRVLCNPRGYAKDGQVENARFNPHLVVEVA